MTRREAPYKFMPGTAQLKSSLSTAALAFLASLDCAQAGSFSTDFNSGLPAGTAVHGNAMVSTNDGTGGGFTNSGCLQLTTNTPSQTGVFIITNNFDGGQAVVSFTARFKAFLGSFGNGADGLSFNFASDLDLSGAWSMPEEGSGTGLTVEFDTFPNAALDTAPSIDVKVGGAEISTNFFPGLRPGVFVDVVIQLNPDATLSVIYDGFYAVSNLDVSALGQVSGGRFGIGARTGSVSDNHFIDDLSITTRTNAGPFVQFFAPQGRRVQTNGTIDIVLTDATTHVNTNSIMLKLDDTKVLPTTLMQDTNGNTSIHFAPPAGFAPYSTHTVSLVFADDSTPTPHTNTWQYSFTVAAQYVVLFSENFESRKRGALDMNLSGGPNAAPNGEAGNPWFGPAPPNSQVVGPQAGVTPHSGTNMIQGTAPSNLDENWYNLAYRLNGGNPYTGDVMLDWWFYDPLGASDTSVDLADFMAIGYYDTAPTDVDYPGTGSLNMGASQIQRLSLGASPDLGAGFDNTKYQARVASADDGYDNGWFNTPTTRSVGWHHGRIIVGPALTNSANNADFYIDDMTNPTFTHNAIVDYGYNVIEINVNYGATSGYYDDISFAVATTPNVPVPTLAASLIGTDLVLTWPGLGFTLQSSTNLVGNSFVDIAGAKSRYTNSVELNPMRFFRLRK